MSKQARIWFSTWAVVGVLLSFVALHWRAEFVHAGDVLLFYLAPYFLFGVDGPLSLVQFALAQALYVAAISSALWWVWERIAG
ncbi:hypothetical protein [Ramlibacter albus]|uniref:Uncharacterized protein n=1 Tax=Ramlibacter albus TaxID=2079448 RepID=A0A923M5H3_9BURK|nr:hypothetical protein [Ramlibacter albus]MBC5764577.1 hypothetical protein [Ramlibacter albus]